MFHFVDDNEDFLEFIDVFASVNGYACQTFNSPLKYLEYAGSDAYQEPVALFTDVRMPQMSGFEMLEKVREQHAGIRMAVISGYADDWNEDSCCLYLHKPVRPEVLQKVFEVFVRCTENGPDDLMRGCREADDSTFKFDCRNCPSIAGRHENS